MFHGLKCLLWLALLLPAIGVCEIIGWMKEAVDPNVVYVAFCNK